LSWDNWVVLLVHRANISEKLCFFDPRREILSSWEGAEEEANVFFWDPPVRSPASASALRAEVEVFGGFASTAFAEEVGVIMVEAFMVIGKVTVA
jgi:hypothetical protein